jgi:hypothetical protein
MRSRAARRVAGGPVLGGARFPRPTRRLVVAASDAELALALERWIGTKQKLH